MEGWWDDEVRRESELQSSTAQVDESNEEMMRMELSILGEDLMPDSGKGEMPSWWVDSPVDTRQKKERDL